MSGSSSPSLPLPLPTGMGGTGQSSGGWKAPFTTVAGLPAASAGNQGQFFIVTDALLPAIGAIIVGGGAVKTLVVSDGTNWLGV